MYIFFFKEENSSNQLSTFSVVSQKKFVKPIFNLFSSFTENSSNDLSIAFNLFFFKTGKFVKSTSNLFSKSTENFVKLNFNFFSLQIHGKIAKLKCYVLHSSVEKREIQCYAIFSSNQVMQNQASKKLISRNFYGKIVAVLCAQYSNIYILFSLF